MILSFSSFLAAFAAGNVMVLFLAVLLRSKSPLSRLGLNVLLLFTAFIGIRMLFPFEFFYTITFPSKVTLPFLFSWLFEHPISLPGGITVYLCQILLTLWISGTFYYLFQIFWGYRKLQRLVRFLPTLNSAQVSMILKEVQKERNDSTQIRIVQTPYIATPALTGFVHPVILLPNLLFEDEELRYILTHEFDHYYRHDLLWKLCFEILTAVYWWNPLMWFLKKELSAITELKADDTVIKSLDAEKRISYLECLARIHKYQIQQLQNSNLILTFSNDKPDSLLFRAHYIINDRKKTHGVGLAIICFMLLVLSTLFIFESYSVSPDVKEESVEVIPEECYFIKLDDSLYEFYSGDTYCGTVTNPYSNDFKNYPIYSKENEVLR
ncbi:M56 family metallopeptidase [Ruminococcus gauvreauii]|uniref:M56 family metallopeptidase n=1 Tax=Ruminococcus gauvreauii TaxID=438033 RepID=A0ABY5VEC2_9FIRM|nr:M56 family metallopeptidase [Ruminococcus gauvreauii]UWP58662.1 M56 family metallopeptidase [Ruminococcus gauvreauii]